MGGLGQQYKDDGEFDLGSIMLYPSQAGGRQEATAPWSQRPKD
jgi:hypothetical protein